MAMVCTPGAELAVHQKTVMACRVTPEPLVQQADGRMEGQAWGTLTRDWLALSDGLREARGTHVAMESPGASWKPVDNLLEGIGPVLLANAAQVKHGPGHKTDRADARWLAQRMRHGLVPASVLPPAEQRDRWDLTRDRTKLGQERRQAANHGQGVLERATIQLVSVAALAQGHLRSKLSVLEPALTGVGRDHHRRWVAMPLAPNAFLEEQLEVLSADSPRSVPPRRRRHWRPRLGQPWPWAAPRSRPTLRPL